MKLKINCWAVATKELGDLIAFNIHRSWSSKNN